MRCATLSRCCLGVAAAASAMAAMAGDVAQGVTSGETRWVFLGSSTTDGFTYALLLRQALRDAGRTVPVCINAGIGGDTASGMLARLDRDVLCHTPDCVILQGGGNDVGKGTTVPQYEALVETLVTNLTARGLRVVLQTPSIRGPRRLADETLLAGYAAAVQAVARRHGCAVAEVFSALSVARGAGAELTEADDIHLNLAGCRILAATLLKALGLPEVDVPVALDVQPLPGLVRQWRVRAVTDDRPLEAAAVQALQPAADGAGWFDLRLPQTSLQEHWWREQIRREGYALGIDQVVGKARRYVAVASVDAAGPSTASIAMGAGAGRVWLNGVLVFDPSPGFRGYHVGRDRVAVELRSGTNQLVVETGNEFVVCVTPHPLGVWRMP